MANTVVSARVLQQPFESIADIAGQTIDDDIVAQEFYLKRFAPIYGNVYSRCRYCRSFEMQRMQ